MASKDWVLTLVQLDKSSPQFSDKLVNILARREFDEYIKRLHTDELEPVVEYLDEVPFFH
jgi:hypothetical protein